MIRSLMVEGLNGRISATLDFHDDINIITGTNGSGKTTILKLIWFMISGNFEVIPGELTFRRVRLRTDSYDISGEIERDSERFRRYRWSFIDLSSKDSAPEHFNSSDEQIRLLNARVMQIGSSVFLPTFRRIEGGFAMRPDSRRTYYANVAYYAHSSDLEDGVNSLAQQLSNSRHRFVASISTVDIVNNLTKQYADISERINEDHRALYGELTEAIGLTDATGASSYFAASDDASRLLKATDTLEDIRRKVESHTAKQDELLKPFTTLNKMIGRIFQHKGISVTSRLTLGDAASAISSDYLSAGEKQMLSFLAYNAFEQGSTVFIDEPEISLHVDWQRTLFPVLLSQGTSNQYIVATHSPFIYSKYSDKELVLDRDRGDSAGSVG